MVGPIWGSEARAGATGSWELSSCPGPRQEVGRLATGTASSLEEQMAGLRQQEQNIINYKSNIDRLEGDHQLLQEGLVFDNKHTVYGMEVRGTCLEGAGRRHWLGKPGAAMAGPGTSAPGGAPVQLGQVPQCAHGDTEIR